jgi:hypothetical protein
MLSIRSMRSVCLVSAAYASMRMLRILGDRKTQDNRQTEWQRERQSERGREGERERERERARGALEAVFIAVALRPHALVAS